jgi:hypothetical protein
MRPHKICLDLVFAASYGQRKRSQLFGENDKTIQDAINRGSGQHLSKYHAALILHFLALQEQ